MFYGDNYFKPNKINTIHAEQSAIDRLPNLTNKKHLKTINIIVVRISKTGMWSMSKPCIHCIKYMNNIAPLKGYRIKRVYYSCEDGSIKNYSLNNMCDDPDYHVSKYFRYKKIYDCM